jgi:cation transport ATPase
MADLARNSQPIAYGLTALLALQKLMRMIMEWQTHRQELTEKRDALSRSQLLSLLAQHEHSVSARTAVSDEARHEAATAITRLDLVLAADMLEPEDPRARPDQ